MSVMVKITAKLAMLASEVKLRRLGVINYYDVLM